MLYDYFLFLFLLSASYVVLKLCKILRLESCKTLLSSKHKACTGHQTHVALHFPSIPQGLPLQVLLSEFRE